MPRLRIKLWMLFVLVAIVGLALAGQRWRRERRVILDMAKRHEQQAKIFDAFAKFESERVADFSDSFQSQFDYIEKSKRILERPYEALESYGASIPDSLPAPMAARQAEVETQRELFKSRSKKLHDIWLDASRWHAARARQLRRIWLFDLKRERERDAQQTSRDERRVHELDAECAAELSEARSIRKEAEVATHKALNHSLARVSRFGETPQGIFRLELDQLQFLRQMIDLLEESRESLRDSSQRSLELVSRP